MIVVPKYPIRVNRKIASAGKPVEVPDAIAKALISSGIAKAQSQEVKPKK